MTQRRQEQEREEKRNILKITTFALMLPGAIVTYILAPDDKELRADAETSLTLFGSLLTLNILVRLMYSMIRLNILVNISLLVELLTVMVWLYVTVQSFKGNKIELLYLAKIQNKIFPKEGK